MVYGTDEFKLKIDLFLEHTGQYIYISSSRYMQMKTNV